MKNWFNIYSPLRGLCLAVCTLICAVGITSCGDDYDDTDIKKEIQDVKDRVAKLEEWQKSVNSDITSIKGLIEALQQKNFITDVTPVTEGGEEVGYTITFQTGKSITIKNGVNGKTPIIGVAKEGDTYYWTIKTGDADAVFMTDAEGNKIPVTGPKGENGADAVAPQVRINAESNEWELSTDGGETWSSTGVKATGANGENGEKGEKGDKGDRGDAIFAEDGIDTESDPDNVIFTLADGTTLTIPKAKEMSVGFESYDVITIAQNANEIRIVLPPALQETDFVALAAEVKSESGTGMDIYTKAGSPWKVTVTAPTFTDGKYDDNAKVKIEAAGVGNGEKAILKVTLITSNGKEFSASRAFEYFNGVIVDVAQAGGLEAALEGVAAAEINGLRVTGTLGEDDFTFIRESLVNLEHLDILGTDLTEIPDRALAFYDGDNTTIKEIVLPKGLIKVGEAAFANCTALEKLTLPSTVRELGRWMLEECRKVTTINIPDGVKEIPASCFYHSGIIDLEVPTSVETIGSWAFEGGNLETIKLHDGITFIGEAAFDRCNIKEFTVPAGVTEIDNWMFNSCLQLKSVTLHDNITFIGERAFFECKSLTNKAGEEEFVLPNKLERLGDEVFMACDGLTDVNMYSCPFLKDIPFNAFCGCKNLNYVILPHNLEKIGGQAFAESSVRRIFFPMSLQSIEKDAFRAANNMYKIECHATKVPTLGKNAFPESYKTNCTLYVTTNILDLYTGEWGSYFKAVKDKKYYSEE